MCIPEVQSIPDRKLFVSHNEVEEAVFSVQRAPIAAHELTWADSGRNHVSLNPLNYVLVDDD